MGYDNPAHSNGTTSGCGTDPCISQQQNFFLPRVGYRKSTENAKWTERELDTTIKCEKGRTRCETRS